MSARYRFVFAILGVAVVLALPGLAAAHDPLFAPSPHPLFKGGTEYRFFVDYNDTTGGHQQTSSADIFYGVTGDWTVGVRLPYVRNDTQGNDFTGLGDVSLFSRYELWERQGQGYEDAFGAFGAAGLPTGDRRARNWETGGAAWSGMAGLAYWHEGIRWYWWVEGWDRYHGLDNASFRRGNEEHLDLILGRRFNKPVYTRPDFVGTVALNNVHLERNSLGGRDLTDSGGTQIFISPGVFATYRNYGAKFGVQLPVYQNLNGDQPSTNYRLRFELVAHF